jgi:hypothetical protein
MIKFNIPYPDNCDSCKLNEKACRALYWITTHQNGWEDGPETRGLGCPILKDEVEE